MKKIINNIPNAVTISRIISCVVGSILFTMGNIIPAVCFYVYGAVSDAFDGFLARKLNAVSDFGKKLDPVSDKIFALSLMMPAILLKNYFMILPLIFEGIISGINVYSEIKYKNTHTEKVGKLKTIMLFPTMILGLLVTLEPYLFIAFVPSLFATLKLQAKSAQAYVEQFNELKNLDNKEYNNEIECADNKLNKITSNDEVVVNIKKNTKNSTKKLVRKKDYNDRY